MKNAKHLPHTSLQNNKWQFLIRIPKDVLGTKGHKKYFNGKVRFKRSLGSGDIKECLDKYKQFSLEYESLLKLARENVKCNLDHLINKNGLAKAYLGEVDLIRIQREFYERAIFPILKFQERMRNYDFLKERDQIEEDYNFQERNSYGELAQAYDSFLNGDAHHLRRMQGEPDIPINFSRSVDHLERALAAQEKIKHSYNAELETKRIMVSMNLHAVEEDKLVIHLNHAERKVGERIKIILKGDMYSEPEGEFLKIDLKELSETKTLSEIVEELELHATKSTDWFNKVNKVVQLFDQYLQCKKTVNKITRRDVKLFVEKMSRFPVDAKRKFGDLNFHQTLEENKKRKYQTLSYTSVKGTYLAPLKFILNEAVSLGYINNNPAEKVKAPNQEKHKVSKEGSFEIEALNRLFLLPVFTGSKSKKLRYDKGDVLIKDHIYWVPLIALYTGFRCGEIANILIDNIHIKTPHPSINIFETEEIKFKTPNAERSVPILNALKELGFFEYVKKKAALGHRRLFEEWKPSKKGIYSTASFIRIFNDRMTRKALGGRYDPENDNFDKNAVRPKSFHSLRKNFKTLLIHAGVNQAIANQILGHSQVGMDKVYVDKFEVKKLYVAVNELNYEGLNLSHLVIS